MDLQFSLEQSLLKDSVSAFTHDYLAGRRKTSCAASEGFSRDTWRQIIELGWLAVGLSEADGGIGGGPVDTMVIQEGMGVGLVVEPLASSALAARVVALAGSADQRSTLLPWILSGEVLAVLAHHENAGRGDPLHIETTAFRTAGGWALRGLKDMVLDAPSANLVILPARLSDSGEIALFAVDAARLSKRLVGCETIDGLRAADIILDDFQVSDAERMTGTDDVEGALMEALDHAILDNCAQAVGAMDAMLALTIDYLNTRRQFGAPIGSFQALQHKLADMVIAVELARSILLHGVASLTEADPAARGRGVSAAKVRIIESADLVGAHAIQLHGGIGVTDEHIISHYFRKLAMLSRRLGGVDYHLARFAAG